jgi:UDP-N-acetylglucosamine 2-epimerase (non-hydrolysing)
MKIDIIAGARPNFMKIAPIIEAIKKAQKKHKNLSFRLIHTGQHYDKKMSGDFFEQLGIPEPNLNLGAGGGTQAEQTAAIMTRYEKALMDDASDLCLVVGDVTSTMACSIVAKKMNMKVAHVEAGIRSFDVTMPEEINRMVTDAITDYFYTTSATANQNLRKAGTPKEKIQFVGNTMIDTLYKNLNRLQKPPFWDEYALESGNYFVVTLHRPANVDHPEKLKEYIKILTQTVKGLPVIFPIHPRTAKILGALDVVIPPNFRVIEPLGYLEFIYLIKNAKAVITDSGGITEETTVLKVPCITLRDNTERPETVTKGTNELIGTNPQAIIPALDKLFKGEWKKGEIPPLWDGKTGKRIVAHLIKLANEPVV